MFPARRNVYNPEFAALLKATIPNLWDGIEADSGKDTQICFAIGLTNVREKVVHEAVVRELQDEIQKRLGQNHSSWYGWYIDKHESTLQPEAKQAKRLAWMLDMIEEFSTPRMEKQHA